MPADDDEVVLTDGNIEVLLEGGSTVARNGAGEPVYVRQERGPRPAPSLKRWLHYTTGAVCSAVLLVYMAHPAAVQASDLAIPMLLFVLFIGLLPSSGVS